MRGKVKIAVGGYGDIRITPAYAGKSIGLYPAMLSAEDHPRLCGEKAFTHTRFSPL